MNLRKNRKNNTIQRDTSSIFVNQSKGRFSSFFGQTLGFILAGTGGAAFLVLLLYSLLRGNGLESSSYFMLLLFFAGGFLFYRSQKRRKFYARFRFYRRIFEDLILEDRNSISLKELSDVTGRKEKFLRQDLKKMIKERLLLKASLDAQEKVLLLTEEERINPSYQEKEKEDRSYVEEQLVFYEQAGKKIKSKPVQRIVTDLGVYTVQISSYGIEKDDIARFLSYYLPVTKELLISYESMEKEGIAGDAKDLEDILNTIRFSFETFARRLSEGKSMDVETDILALEDIWRNE